MEEIDFSHKPHDEEHHDEDSDGGLLSRKLISLIIGALVIVLVIAGGVYAFTRSNVKQSAKKQVTKVTSTPEQKDQPTQTAKQPSNPTWKTYTESTFGYTVKMPNEWEAFVRAGDDTAQQIALHPVGSQDVPLTINAQTNYAGVTVDEFITMQYGTDYPREKRTIGGKESTFVRNDANGYTSYFVANGNNLYEIAATTLKPEYDATVEAIIRNFKFTTGSSKGGL